MPIGLPPARATQFEYASGPAETFFSPDRTAIASNVTIAAFFGGLIGTNPTEGILLEIPDNIMSPLLKKSEDITKTYFFRQYQIIYITFK